MNWKTVVISVLTLIASANPPQPVAPADLVLTNGRVLTVEDALPEAQALAIKGDRIAAFGTSAEMRRYVGPATQVIDLNGQLAIPGEFDQGQRVPARLPVKAVGELGPDRRTQLASQ